MERTPPLPFTGLMGLGVGSVCSTASSIAFLAVRRMVGAAARSLLSTSLPVVDLAMRAGTAALLVSGQSVSAFPGNVVLATSFRAVADPNFAADLATRA